MPALVGPDVGWLLVDTERRYDVSIDLGRAREWGWAYERTGEMWGRSPSPDFFALGRGLSGASVFVRGSEEDADKRWRTWGELGARFFAGGALALDPIDAAVGWSATLDLERAIPDRTLRVPLVEAAPGGVALTDALEDSDSSGERPCFMLDTGRSRSVLSLEYVNRAWRSARERRQAARAHTEDGRVGVYLRVPGRKKAVWLEAEVYERTAVWYTEEEGGRRVDGYLGVDFLFQWLPVIDFARSTLWLTPLLDS